MKHHRSTAATPFVVTRFTEWLALAATVCVIQIELAPFDFLSQSGRSGENRLLTTDTGPFRAADAIANVALFVPIGLLGYAFFRKRRWGLAVSGAGAIAFGALLSLAMEWLQAYSPTRVSSLIDVAANIAGVVFGVLLGTICHAFIPRIIGTIVYEIRRRPTTAALKLYCALLFVMAALPLTFSLDRGRLAEAWKSSTFVPFAVSPAESALLNTPPEGDRDRAMELADWTAMRRWGRWAAESASFVVFALLMHAVLRGDYGFSRRAAIALTCWTGGLLAFCLSAIQIPVVTRAVDATDILFRLIGLLSGLYFSSWCGKQPEAEPWSAARVLSPLTGRLGGFSVTAFVVYMGLIPFSFRADAGAAWSAINSAAMTPFVSYAQARFNDAFADFADKVALFAVWAAVYLCSSTPRFGRFRGVTGVRVVFVGVALSVAVEVVQVLLPIRVPSFTDPIVAAVGCLLGVGAYRSVQSLFRFAASHELIQPDKAVRIPRDVPLALPDQLIATLSEPDPKAPAEGSPHRVQSPNRQD